MSMHNLVTGETRRDLVRYLAKRTHDEALAEDLAHDAIVRLVSFGDTRSAREPRALLFRIAQNLLATDWKRRNARPDPQPVEAVNDTLPDPAADPEQRSIARDQLERLDVVLADMPPKRREVLLRRRLEGESYAQIAAAMGLSLAAVEKHMTRALLTLHAAAAEEGILP